MGRFTVYEKLDLGTGAQHWVSGMTESERLAVFDERQTPEEKAAALLEAIARHVHENDDAKSLTFKDGADVKEQLTTGQIGSAAAGLVQASAGNSSRFRNGDGEARGADAPPAE